MLSFAGWLVDEMTAVISPEYRSLYARHLTGACAIDPRSGAVGIAGRSRVSAAKWRKPVTHASTTGTLCPLGAECANATRLCPAELARYGARPPVSYPRSSAAINIDEIALAVTLRVSPALVRGCWICSTIRMSLPDFQTAYLLAF